MKHITAIEAGMLLHTALDKLQGDVRNFDRLAIEQAWRTVAVIMDSNGVMTEIDLEQAMENSWVASSTRQRKFGYLVLRTNGTVWRILPCTKVPGREYPPEAQFFVHRKDAEAYLEWIKGDRKCVAASVDRGMTLVQSLVRRIRQFKERCVKLSSKG